MFRFLPALILALATAPAMGQTCKEIRFAPGTSSGVILGEIGPEEMQCFMLGVGNGQAARIEILEGSNVAFNIRDVAEVAAQASFTTQAGSYRIDVFQFLPSAVTQRYRLYVAVE